MTPATNGPGETGAQGASYEAQLGVRAAEQLPDLNTSERLELLGVMDPDDLRTSLAFIISQSPQMFDFALVRDSKLVERLQDRLDHQYDDDPEPYCSRCGDRIGIFIGHGDGWHHYTGEGTVENPVNLYPADHETEVAWRVGTAGAAS